MKKIILSFAFFIFLLCACGKENLVDEVNNLFNVSYSSTTIEDCYEVIDLAREILKKFEKNGLNSDEYVDLFMMYNIYSNIDNNIDRLEWEYRFNKEKLAEVQILEEEYLEFQTEVSEVAEKTNFKEKYEQYMNKLNEAYNQTINEISN